MLTKRSLVPIGLFTALELIAVGGLGAWLAVRLNFPYVYLTPVAFLIYGAAGFYGSRAGAAGWICGAIAATIDAGTWAAFGGIGPQPTDPQASFWAKVGTVAFAMVLGAVCGLIGARLTRRGGTPTHEVAA